MLCPLCRTRKARRSCPALGQSICAVCCGTKRLSEISCPADCTYLASAREHPAAVVRRQQERDVAVLLPTLQGLTERQYQLFFIFQTAIARHKPEGFSRLIDDDVADAAGSMAATLETAARGVIYEHAAQSLPAQRLATDLKAVLAEVRQQGATVYDREAAIVLRAIERGAREARKVESGDSAYLTLMARLLQQNLRAQGTAEPTTAPTSSLILP
jgi:hypothetical protein